MTEKDTWYPAAATGGLVLRHDIPVQTIAEARNHFFTGGWKRVWADF